MTKRHFQRAAEIISAVSDVQQRMLLADAFARFFAAENPRFDRERFLAVCGLEPGKKATVQ